MVAAKIISSAVAAESPARTPLDLQRRSLLGIDGMAFDLFLSLETDNTSFMRPNQ